MPIKLDYAVARQRFAEALELALSNAEVPLEWMEHTRVIGQSPAKTYIAVLATAMLAKATDPRVDPLSLKTRDYPNAYLARSLCKDVLVPAAVRASVSLGTTGAEPFNNQPFFRHERIGREMVVRESFRWHLDYLVGCLERLIPLDAAASRAALAAFIRVRVVEKPTDLLMGAEARVIGLPTLTEVVAGFVTRDPEEGRRGQALVAACLDLVFDDVRTSRVNDPSRHWPGDVAVSSDGKITLTAEVKQRPATETEILQFAARLSAKGIARGLVAALHPGQPSLPVSEMQQLAWEQHRVHLMLFLDPRDLLLAALTWSAKPLGETLGRFPRLMDKRLRQLEVSRAGIAEWLAIFEPEP
ncbi:MAG TPA: restriction endonuclease, SacI family [Isosphaeraceae bacterium]|jgi:hypothetical protein|nr:restriction endonuclease, SacI family [Isosphaeraceae bacterium]